jgi:hypothetical protein
MKKHPLKAYNYNLYLHSPEGWVGLIRYNSLEEARDVLHRYEDESTRLREGIQSCWITDANTCQMILGRQPLGWSPDGPVYENDTRDIRTAAIHD